MKRRNDDDAEIRADNAPHSEVPVSDEKADQVAHDSSTLSPAERLRLVDAVWDDEHPENWPALSPEWLAEVQRRSAEFDAGRMKASPWEDVQARVRRKAGLDG